MKDSREGLSEQVCNALTELGNIGAGNAATSMSMLLSSKLVVTQPTVKIYGFNELEDILGGPDAMVAGVLATVEGDLQTMLLFVMEVDAAKVLARRLLNDSADWEDEMSLSAIQEIGNIIIGSYVASLETLSGMKIRYSNPTICVDMAAAILSVPCIQFGKVSDKALLINSQFKSGEYEINGYIMMVSDVHSYDVLLSRLGIGGLNE